MPFDRTAAYRQFGPRIEADRDSTEELYAKAGARTADADSLEEVRSRIRGGSAPGKVQGGSPRTALLSLAANVGRCAAYLGYDAVVDRSQGVWLILNRTAL